MSSVIKIENLWKEYRLGVIGHGTLTHDLQSWWARVCGKEDPNSKITSMLAGQEKQIDGDYFWALQDINLDVKEGEIFGIIGKNGAGKSTLLKILSRVTAPTKGSIKVKGRIASLLEVGTGFHPELTGRENIFMNGAILGMSKQEIRSKLDEIIDFSGVEDFVDTPVKRYSSGMYVRLAFAVAAHLEPEILVVDEVLAVGDANFQKRCLGKMEEVSHSGRTILFVSHNMAAIEKICTRGILLQQGKVGFQGTQKEAVNYYMQRQEELSNTPLHDRNDRSGTGSIRIEKIEFKGNNGQILEQVSSGQDFSIHLKYKRRDTVPCERVFVAVMFKNSNDIAAFQHHNRLTRELFESLPVEGEFILNLPKIPLIASAYRMTYSVLLDGEYLDHITDAIELTVIDGDYYNTGETTPAGHGICLVEGSWRVIGM
ncbi:ABC transporter ATP-binding protein [Desulfobulbus sp. TB]|nr:ABC transporter ATP-binding protein [Desulfobulbus sp. TB]